MNGGANCVGTPTLSRKTKSARSAPTLTSVCAGSAEWNSHVRSSCRKKSLRKRGRMRRSKISCFFSNTNRFTQLGALLIDPACPPQDRKSDGELGGSHLPHPLFSINRGGQATYHGPGQLMGYPIIDLRRCGQDLHKYLRWLEQLLIDLLARYDIAAQRRESLTGVWVENRKIASIGVGVRHWITMHGFALNVCGDLSPFDHIVPCGINNVAITSMEKETKKSFTVAEVAPTLEKLALDSIVSLRVAPETQLINA